jgi:hypothetical protein
VGSTNAYARNLLRPSSIPGLGSVERGVRLTLTPDRVLADAAFNLDEDALSRVGDDRSAGRPR